MGKNRAAIWEMDIREDSVDVVFGYQRWFFVASSFANVGNDTRLLAVKRDLSIVGIMNNDSFEMLTPVTSHSEE